MIPDCPLCGGVLEKHKIVPHRDASPESGYSSSLSKRHSSDGSKCINCGARTDETGQLIEGGDYDRSEGEHQNSPRRKFFQERFIRNITGNSDYGY